MDELQIEPFQIPFGGAERILARHRQEYEERQARFAAARVTVHWGGWPWRIGGMMGAACHVDNMMGEAVALSDEESEVTCEDCQRKIAKCNDPNSIFGGLKIPRYRSSKIIV